MAGAIHNLEEGLMTEQVKTSDTICLVTIHGIGFQQSPEPESNVEGYAVSSTNA